MIKKYASILFVALIMFGNFALGSVLITFQGSDGQINRDSYTNVVNRIGELVKKDAIRTYKVTSLDIAGSVQICVEFIDCTSQDQRYINYFSKEISDYNFNPAPKFEISGYACK